jgi:aryl-alcohol dehydrogenase-like predicted oxidoreductase
MLSRYVKINISRLSTMATLQPEKMIYSNFGNSGLKVSKLAFGTGINHKPETYEEDKRIIECCLKNGINHFDAAELYDFGGCERQLGKILQDLKVPR